MMLFAFIVCLLNFVSTSIGHPVNDISSRSIGDVKIVNTLTSPVYVWSVGDSEGPMSTIPANGGTYEEIFRVNPKGGDISIKVSTTPDLKVNNVMQFQYNQTGDKVVWDVSCESLKLPSPFTNHGFSVQSSSNDCPSIKCAPGNERCPDVYPWLKATHACPLTTSFTFNL
ncbi:hypothetical protein BDV28DRAFT_150847 [Aspergillus coremiiformis]|uniref:Uncharacterized protein n=1 Tax=Aspergillus coremiiformis TaxID=138285 RepID=A0A5N6Z016_9EURO|nr:hypothetical protein BDV28DRAFT_150847 [Aspergillus coremiiformis]